MKTLSRIFLSVLLILLPFSLCNAASTAHAQRPINRQELVKLFNAGKAIRNRIIQADDILEIFRSAYVDAKLKGYIKTCGKQQATPKSGQEDPESRELQIEGSIINGKLDTYELRVPDCELPEAVYQHFQEVNFLHEDPRGTASIIPIPIYIKNSAFQEPVSLTNTVFLNQVTFEKVTFQGITNFTGAYFDKSLRFEDLTLGTEDRVATNILFFAAYFDSVEFQKVSFKGNADFPESTFQSAEFTDTTFEGVVSFERASFFKLSVEDVTFKDLAHFDQTLFPEAKEEDETSFVRVNFQADAEFTRAKIPAHLFFFNTNFLKDAFFNDLNKEATGPL